MKMYATALTFITLLAIRTNAFPHIAADALKSLARDPNSPSGCPYTNTNKPGKRQNGFDPSTQYVSTTGPHAFVAPDLTGGDQRGPCPGLNALANHGYLPHDGVADIPTIIDAVETGEMHSMAKTLIRGKLSLIVLMMR